MQELAMKLWLRAGKTKAEVWKSLKGSLRFRVRRDDYESGKLKNTTIVFV